MELNAPTEIVQASGGLVVRRQAGLLQIALVHRPVHQDWSYPKGKLEEGESFEEAARREVMEETGLTCRLLRFIGHTEYVDRKGRPKVVAYWVMAVEVGAFVINDEVDELRWLAVTDAAELLSYERDRELLGVSWPRTSLSPWFKATAEEAKNYSSVFEDRLEWKYHRERSSA